VTVVSAPAGSGKTILLRSWIGQAGLAGRAALVPVGRDERDPQRFWLSVLGALRQTPAGAGLVRALTAAPDLDGWAIVERLLKDLAPLDERLWLVIDDVHELGSDLARLLLMRAPPGLRFILATRHDVRLGLHRLRLEGELTEIRAGDLRFSLAEARELLASAGVQLAGPARRAGRPADGRFGRGAGVAGSGGGERLRGVAGRGRCWGWEPSGSTRCRRCRCPPTRPAPRSASWRPRLPWSSSSTGPAGFARVLS
jgi:hypothetical protein